MKPDSKQEALFSELFQIAAKALTTKILPRKQAGPMPLSFAQQRMWLLNQLIQDNPAYNVARSFHITGAVDALALEAGINEIIRRHEVLRTTFHQKGEQTVQVITPVSGPEAASEGKTVPLSMVDLRTIPEPERKKELQKRLTEKCRVVFDLAKLPLLKTVLYQLGEREYVFLLTMHHIVSDGWSITVFFRELAKVYGAFTKGKTSPLSELPVQYADFSVWEKENFQGDMFKPQLEFWQKKLSGRLPVSVLPTDYPRPAAQTFRGAGIPVDIPAELTGELRKLGQQEGTTLFMALLAAFKTLLFKYSGQGDIIVGSPIANRNHPQLAGLMGFFVNTLAFRTELNNDFSFKEQLSLVRQTTLDAYAHQELPFEKLVEVLQPDRERSYSPVFQVMFVLQNMPEPVLEFSGLKLTPMALDNGTSKFDLTLILSERDNALKGELVYNTDLFDKATVKRMGEHFQRLLKAVVSNPFQKISKLSLLSEVERKYLVNLNETCTEYPKGLCVHQLFETRAATTPDALAVEFGNDKITYGLLSRRSSQLANYIKLFGVGPQVLVGISMDRSIGMIIGMLGILKAGGGYVPLDPACPGDRLAYMLADTGLKVLLTQEKYLETLPRHRGKVICIDTGWEAVSKMSKTPPPHNSEPEHVAYVMYTSGSTGRPKGVRVPHRAINRLVTNTNYITLAPSDRVAQASNTAFDAATFEIWGALLNGACLVGLERHEFLSEIEFTAGVRKKGITVLFLTTALFNQIAAKAPHAFSPLRYLLFGGETADPKWARKVLQNGPPEHLIHVYGPTENTTFSTWYYVDDVPEDAATIPIGRPVSNTQCYILDKYRQIVPVGIPGELYLGGDGLAEGYHNRPELSVKKFIQNPFSDLAGSHLYRSGDLARYRHDGAIEFIGRFDNQVKIRGFRIEPGEIEAVLSSHSWIKAAVVVAREETAGNIYLVAYVVMDQERSLDIKRIRQFVSRKLPDYMLPSSFVFLESLPLTANGKVNRHALPEPDKKMLLDNQNLTKPRMPLEKALAKLWARILNFDAVGVYDNFFDLGGHSLLAMHLIAWIYKDYGVELTVKDIFEEPTISELAVKILKKKGVHDSKVFL